MLRASLASQIWASSWACLPAWARRFEVLLCELYVVELRVDAVPDVLFDVLFGLGLFFGLEPGLLLVVKALVQLLLEQGFDVGGRGAPQGRPLGRMPGWRVGAGVSDRAVRASGRWPGSPCLSLSIRWLLPGDLMVWPKAMMRYNLGLAIFSTTLVCKVRYIAKRALWRGSGLYRRSVLSGCSARSVGLWGSAGGVVDGLDGVFRTDAGPGGRRLRPSARRCRGPAGGL